MSDELRARLKGIERTQALIPAWLDLHTTALRTPPQSVEGNEALLNQINVDDVHVRFNNDMPFWRSTNFGHIEDVPPTSLGSVWVSKASLHDLRNISLYCDDETWQRAEQVLIQDRSAVIVGSLREKSQLMGVRVIEGKRKLVPLDLLSNDLAAAKGQDLDESDNSNINLAMLRLKDLRRPKGDVIDKGVAKVIGLVESAAQKTLALDQDGMSGAILMQTENLLRQAQEQRWGIRTQ